MIYETIHLSEELPHVTLTTYVADEAYEPRDAILIIPGGAYQSVCADREGEPIAFRFLAAGVNAFVLNYTISDGSNDPLNLQPLRDASMAMTYIRRNAERYHVNPKRVFAIGFSAGGHLTASLGTLWHLPELQQMLPEAGDMNRPEGVLLCYPVLTMGEYSESTTRRHLTNDDPVLCERFSIEKHVDGRSSPAFIMHTATDQAVPVENALLTAEAYAAAGVTYELHIYPRGIHGVALADKTTWRGVAEWVDPAAATWVDSALRWMERIPSRA